MTKREHQAAEYAAEQKTACEDVVVRCKALASDDALSQYRHALLLAVEEIETLRAALKARRPGRMPLVVALVVTLAAAAAAFAMRRFAPRPQATHHAIVTATRDEAKPEAAWTYTHCPRDLPR